LAALPRDNSVFVNCPFDARFQALFDAVAFAVAICGYKVRSALEISDSGEVRLHKIIRILECSRFSIHDISRVELDSDSGLPRFNMPIELGIALGMKHLGRLKLRDHSLLVLDSERYRYQKFASDLAGLDISAHANDTAKVIAAVRNFLATHSPVPLPSPSVIADAYGAFEAALPAMANAARQAADELTYRDRLDLIDLFLRRLAP